jgi:hypothetical protein
MMVPVPGRPHLTKRADWTRQPVEWAPATVTTSYYQGTIYSLEVADDHNYVADGIVTHNCLPAAEELRHGRQARSEREDTLLEHQRASGLLTD